MRSVVFTLLAVSSLVLSATAANRIMEDATAIGPALELSPADLPLVFMQVDSTSYYFITLRNVGTGTLTVSQIGKKDEHAVLTLETNGPLSILEGDSARIWLRLWGNPSAPSGDVAMHSEVYFICNALPPLDSVTLNIGWIIVDPFIIPPKDTLYTACIPLVVDGNLNSGDNWAGGVNLNFAAPTECDNGGNSRGDANIYLGDASPVIIRKLSSPNSYAGSWSMYTDITHTFRWLDGAGNPGPISGTGYTGFRSGTVCTIDSLVNVEKTWYAPTSPDSCKFILQKMQIFPHTIGMSVPNLAIGEAFDFDVPSDSGDIYNIGGTDPTRRLVYQRAFDSQDGVTDCYPNDRRYAGAALIGMHFKNCAVTTSLLGGYTAANDSFVYPAGDFVPEQLWNKMQQTGYASESRITDLHTMLIYQNGASTGFTLPANDTLTVWTVIAVVRPSGGTALNGLDSLKREIDKAFRWFTHVADCVYYTCCLGKRGNVNMSVNDSPDLADLSLLIASLTTNPRPSLPCFGEADTNGDGRIDMSDLSCFIGYMTITPRPDCFADCPRH